MVRSDSAAVVQKEDLSAAKSMPAEDRTSDQRRRRPRPWKHTAITELLQTVQTGTFVGQV